MRAARWKELLVDVLRLSGERRAELAAALGAVGRPEAFVCLLELRLQPDRRCPLCQGDWVVRNGFASGLQRYKCRSCRRTFDVLSTTPLAKLRMKSKWLDQQVVLQEGLTVSKAAEALDVADSTAFRWRLRFLQLTQEVRPAQLTGVVEADEAFFRRSSKGQRSGCEPRKLGSPVARKDRGSELIPILVARDRSGATADFLLEAVSKSCFAGSQRGRIQDDEVLCTDGSAALAAAAVELGVQHQAVNTSQGQRTRGPWYVQNVNEYHHRLKGWIQRFNGVATSYLENYLGWFRALDHAAQNRPKTAPMLALGICLGLHH